MPNAKTRFANLLIHIEKNLDAQLDTSSLSEIANLSKYHFHRQCKSAWGISIHSVIKLLRMKRAAYLLAYRDDHKILTIALISGFDSHEAFSRSFKEIFELSPSAFRSKPDWRSWHKHYEPIIQLRKKIMSSEPAHEVKVVEFPEQTLAVLEHRGSPKTLGNTIRSFIQWRKQNGLPPSKARTFNLLYDDPNDVTSNKIASYDYRFDVGCSFDGVVQKNDSGIIQKSITGGKCAMIRHIGSDDAIEQKVAYLYSQWIGESGYALRDFPLFFERVSFFPDVSENEMVTDIYLPIE